MKEFSKENIGYILLVLFKVNLRPRYRTLWIIGISALLSLLFWPRLEAKHIIGGDIQYECLGNGTYRIIMKIYRDCRPQEQAASLDGSPGDPQNGAFITIYQGNTRFRTVQTLAVPLQSQAFVDAPDFPCLIPPDNLCVEEGVYEFEITFAEWPSNESYHIVYQRCCRNNTITNIVAPGDHGATYTIEITPEAQAVCNNSPVFREFPPTVICVDNEVDFDHSAVDVEGDSLVYSFCFPLEGGGTLGGPDNPGVPGDAFTCAGVRPNPGCAPPFGRINFKPPYQYNQPMAGDPLVSIDPVTGLISGKPQLIGQFVMAVCVEEYRGGVLLSKISRDFQFNVADCDPTVFAKVKSDAVVGDREFVINSCGINTIFFENESEIERFIDTYRWEFDINGNTTVVDTRDAEITFPGEGTYRGVMMVNPGLDCGDTAEIFVNLFPSILADFSFAYDTCLAGPTIFTDLSMTGADRIVSWDWKFGEGGTSARQNPSYIYPIPGNHQIVLTVEDNNECVDSSVQTIPYFPVPPLIVVQPSNFLGCSPAVISFNNLSVPIDSTYDINWDFGDGTTGVSVSPTHIYDQTGTFSVSVDITSPIGCFTSASFNSWIEVRESPVADFSFFPEEPSNFNPTVSFSNGSQNHIAQQWAFGNAGRSSEQHPTFTFPDTGRYLVSLIAIHENGCRDTTLREIDVLPRVTYHMPNAFTPNGDGKNDLFIGTGFLDGMQDFEMSIWSRWGELLYLTQDPTEAWNGSKDNQGQLLPAGVYVYQVKYRNPRGEPVEFRGFATLIL